MALGMRTRQLVLNEDSQAPEESDSESLQQGTWAVGISDSFEQA